MPRKKRRGLRASRARLERALAASDLPQKTQIALANRIADLEELESIPRDLVSRIFREQPVDAHSIERVARALGVKSEDLYLEPASAAMPEPAEGGRARRRYPWTLAALLAAALGIFILVQRPADLMCTIGEAVSQLEAAPDRLGLMIARFEGDPSDSARDFLAASLTADPDLAPYLSVLLTCARPHWGDSGDFAQHLAAIRESAQAALADSGAYLLLWGKRDGDDIAIRFVSTRSDASPVRVEIGGRPLAIRESGIALRLPFGRPSEALADLKRLILDLTAPDDPHIAHLRSEAARRFSSSIEWLRASIVSGRNLRRTIERDLDPRRWAAVNAQLCYELRLLGDYDADPESYREALNACEETLAVRPRERFPRDWAAAQIDKASALIRLHYYTRDHASAVDFLERAAAALVDARMVATEETAPQLWITAQRNLGTAYLRLGELSDGPASGDYFDRAIALLETALAAQDPEVQPLDWAITQQNICLAQYQHAARRGPAAIDLVSEAKRRCEEAQARLSVERTPLSWAMVQNNLAVSTAILAQFEGEIPRLRDAVAAFEKAQTIYTRDRLPGNWAEVETNLGELHCNLARLSGDPTILDDATAHLEAARDVFIDLGNGRYQRYAESLLGAVRSCKAGPPGECTCQP